MIINSNTILDFVKLDLQGGELKALQGFGSIIKQTKLMWIEFTGDHRVIDYLTRNNFELYDSNYMSIGISSEVLNDFGLSVETSKVFSNNKTGFISKRNVAAPNYLNWFHQLQNYGFIQTDLIAINTEFNSEYSQLVRSLANS